MTSVTGMPAPAEYRRLVELNRSRDRFLHTVSHELRTPLTAVPSCTGLLAEIRIRRVHPGRAGTASPAAGSASPSAVRSPSCTPARWLALTSTEGSGTTVTLRLPYAYGGTRD